MSLRSASALTRHQRPLNKLSQFSICVLRCGCTHDDIEIALKKLYQIRLKRIKFGFEMTVNRIIIQYVLVWGQKNCGFDYNKREVGVTEVFRKFLLISYYRRILKAIKWKTVVSLRVDMRIALNL